jgi:hypothetical protein
MAQTSEPKRLNEFFIPARATCERKGDYAQAEKYFDGLSTCARFR